MKKENNHNDEEENISEGNTEETHNSSEPSMNDEKMSELISKYMKVEDDKGPEGESQEIEKIVEAVELSEAEETQPVIEAEDEKTVEELEVKSQETESNIYDEILKNTENPVVFEKHTTRHSRYQGEQSFVNVENPFQRDKNEDSAREITPEPVEVKLPDKELKTFNQIFRDNVKKIFPNKGDKKSEFIRKLVMDVSALTLVCCAIAFGIIAIQSKNAVKNQTGLASQIVDITSDEEEAQVWEDFHAKYPDIQPPEGMMAKYAYLYALNQQLVGWVSIPNSGIDVQVVQSANNTDYLKKDFYGNYSRYGCPFIDYRNDAKYLDQNTIIYGHHMSDKLVFAELSKYEELKGFIDSPIICFDTLYKQYKFKVYAAFITNSRAEDDNGYIFNYTVTNFDSSENFEGFIKALDERKLYTTGVDINSSDNLITLSTCTYEFTDARLVVVGRMLRNGETADVDTTFATTNGNPRYPQAWYTKNGRTNPFVNATKWYPEG